MAWARAVQAAPPGRECSPWARRLCCTTYPGLPASSARSGRPMLSQGAFYGLCSTAPEAPMASVIQLAAAQLAVCATDTSAAPTALLRSAPQKGAHYYYCASSLSTAQSLNMTDRAMASGAHNTNSTVSFTTRRSAAAACQTIANVETFFSGKSHEPKIAHRKKSLSIQVSDTPAQYD